jgi:hypothetical protein
MSDAWVAFIAAGSAIMGAAISGLITYITTRRQVQARLDELRQQLQQDREEARKGRLIEARKGTLLLLREALSNSYSYYQNMRVNAMRIEFLKEKGLPTDPIMNAMSNDPRDPVTNFTEVVSPLIEQIADQVLLDLARSYYDLIVELLSPIFQAMQADSDLTILLDNKNTVPVTTAMLAVNRRIEELLCGD